MIAYRTFDRLLAEPDIKGKPVLLRADLNIPIDEQGEARDISRLTQLTPSLKALSQAGAKTAILSHFGRPKQADPIYSLAPIARMLAHTLDRDIGFVNACIGTEAAQFIDNLPAGGIGVLENTRFHAGEEQNDPAFCHALAVLGQAYVNDAFSIAHRAHASVEGIAHLLPAYAGYALAAELEKLESLLQNPARPLMVAIGGAKISTKLSLLARLLEKADILVIGGGMANNLLAAKNLSVGRSLVEKTMLDEARAILAKAETTDCHLILPQDVVIAPTLAPCDSPPIVAVEQMPNDMMILDIGTKTTQQIKHAIEASKTFVWNGPLGAFEIAPFAKATHAIADHVAARTRQGKLVSVAGGGDTLAALQPAQAQAFTHISTAGGAFLEWLEGKSLAGIKALEINAESA